MSLISLVLGWTKLPAWIQELVAVAVVAVAVWGGIGLWKHHEVQAGVQEQIQRDNVALEQLKTANADKEKFLLKRALAAESAYEQERERDQAYRNEHPIVDARWLCRPTPHRGSPDLPQGTTAHPEDAAKPASPSLGSPVHGGDTPGTEDRLRLLQAFAALLDDQSAVIRQYQSR